MNNDSSKNKSAYVLLIGFQYRGSNYLPGTIVDMWIAYNFFIKNNYTPIIITDIPITSKYNNFLANSIQIKTKDEFNSVINNTNYGINNKFILYYSGHGMNNKILLPDKKTVSIKKIKRQLLINCPCKRYLLIFDGCQLGNVNLPYFYNKITKKIEYLPGNIEMTPTSNKILVFSSAGRNSSALSTEIGSLFSHGFFSILSFKYNLEDIIPYIDTNIQKYINIRKQEVSDSEIYDQNVKIYSSHVFDGDISPWLINDYRL